MTTPPNLHEIAQAVTRAIGRAAAPAGRSLLSLATPGRRFGRRFARNRSGLVGAAWLFGLLVCAAVPALFATHDPLRQDVTLTRLLEGPSWGHWLGTDRYGRDLWSRAVWGARPAVGAIVIGVGLSAGIGVPVGLFSGWAGGRADRTVMWLVDVVFSLPLVLVAMGIVAATGTGLVPAMAVVGVLLSTRFARLVRGVVLAEREAAYVDAARVTGLRAPTVLGRYILPNVLPAVIVQVAIISGAVLVIGAVLSFVGVGSAPDSYDWGAMANQARRDFLTATWQIVPSAAAIVGTVIAFNLVGDAVGDSLARQPAPARNRRPPRRRPARPTVKGPDRGGSDDDGGDDDGDVVLSVRDLTVAYPAPSGHDGGPVEVLDRMSFEVRKGETLGIVGESGAGKSMAVLAALGLVPPPGRVTGGSVRFNGRELTALSERDWQQVRGDQIGVIWQDPVAALNPALMIGAQIAEPLMLHQGLTRRQARQRAVELLAMARLHDPARRAADYPHQLSGGMAQRAGIAVAIACQPDLLIADEPTTALDVTVQGQVLDLLADLKTRLGTTMVIITHDLGVIAETADRVAVVYAGQVVETAPTDELFAHPRHPYTSSLLETMPHNHQPGRPLPVIEGAVPTPSAWPTGCRFEPRCPYAITACQDDAPPLIEIGDHRSARCLRAGDLAGTLVRQHPATSSGPGTATGPGTGEAPAESGARA